MPRLAAGALIVVGVLGAAGNAAAAAPTPAIPDGGCGAFGRTQTYQAWGPAAFYDRPVTVSYSVGGCEASLDGTTFSMSATGSATISDASSGQALETRPFSVTGSWDDPTGAGWPLDAWSCEVETAELTWLIEGAYDFRLAAVGGAWTLDIVVPGDAPLHFEYSGC